VLTISFATRMALRENDPDQLVAGGSVQIKHAAILRDGDFRETHSQTRI